MTEREDARSRPPGPPAAAFRVDDRTRYDGEPLGSTTPGGDWYPYLGVTLRRSGEAWVAADESHAGDRIAPPEIASGETLHWRNAREGAAWPDRALIAAFIAELAPAIARLHAARRDGDAASEAEVDALVRAARWTTEDAARRTTRGLG